MSHFEDFFLVKDFTREEMKQGLCPESTNNLIIYGRELVRYFNEVLKNKDSVDIMEYIKAESNLPMVETKLNDLIITLAYLQKFDILNYKGERFAVFAN